MVALDVSAYPHIVEQIIDAAPPAAIPSLRLVSRGVKDRIDTRLAYHVVLSHYQRSVAPRLSPEHGGLLTASSLAKTRVVTLSSWSGQDGYARTFAEDDLLSLPGLKYVVLDFPVREHKSGSMPRLRPSVTAIHPVRTEWARQVNHPYRLQYQDVVGCHAQKIVFVLRADPRQHAAICSVFYDSALKNREFTVCLLPPQEGGLWLKDIKKQDGHVPLLDTLAVTAANLGTLTIAGLETWDDEGLEASWGALLTDRLGRVMNGTARRGRIPDLNLTSLEDWRQSVGEEEWSIVTNVLD